MKWASIIALILDIGLIILKNRNDPERAELRAVDRLMEGFDRRISDAGKAWADRSTEHLAEVIARHNNARTRHRMLSETDKES